MKNNNKLGQLGNKGFTIVELLVVIVIIGILSTIIAVSYAGITEKATGATLISELDGSKKQLEIFNVENGKYPNTIRCDIADSSINKCLKFNSGTNIVYAPNIPANPTSYELTATKNNISYKVTNTSTPMAVASGAITCPTGFIVVPGSVTYSTNDFCVMKYEAKNDGSNNPTSTASGIPMYVDDYTAMQTLAITSAATTSGCSGCHLITEQEWMTIAQNVLNVASNWGGNAVGNGYIYYGHSGVEPWDALAASSNDNDGYYGMIDYTAINRRTLTLSNGAVIWDFAGNVSEYTSGQISSGKPTVSMPISDTEWPDVLNAGSISYALPSSTGISGSNTWTSINGIGSLAGYPDNNVLRAFVRGGNWNSYDYSGVLSLDISYAPDELTDYTGLRVTSPSQ